MAWSEPDGSTAACPLAQFYGPDEWQAVMRRFFAQPDTLVFGRETASQAGARFARAVDGVLVAHPMGNLVVVAHGTVISLLVAQRAGLDPFSLWQRLDLPSFVVLALPGYEVVDVVERVR